MSSDAQPATIRAHWRATIAASGHVGAGLLAALLATGTVVALVAAPAARGWLGYAFPGLPRTIGEATAILAHNLRTLGAIAGLLLLAALPAHTPRERAAVATIVRGGELLVAGLVAANVLVVGAALGAYGHRMIIALLPRGPVELAAFSLALALYGHGRHGTYPTGTALALLGASAALLAVAAALAVFAAP